MSIIASTLAAPGLGFHRCYCTPINSNLPSANQKFHQFHLRVNPESRKTKSHRTMEDDIVVPRAELQSAKKRVLPPTKGFPSHVAADHRAGRCRQFRSAAHSLARANQTLGDKRRALCNKHRPEKPRAMDAKLVTAGTSKKQRGKYPRWEGGRGTCSSSSSSKKHVGISKIYWLLLRIQPTTTTLGVALRVDRKWLSFHIVGCLLNLES